MRIARRLGFAVIVVAGLAGSDTWAAPAAKTRPAPVAPVAARPRLDFPDPTGTTRFERVWGDGADVLVLAGDKRVLRMERSGAIQEGTGPSDPIAFAMTGTPPSTKLAIAGASGELVIFDGATWEYGLAPALDAEALTGIAYDSTGRLHVAGRHRALYVRELDATWRTYRYPGGGVEVIAAGFGPGGLYLIGAHARVFSFASGQFRELTLTGLTSAVQGAAWTHAWMNGAGDRAWLTCGKHLLTLELPSGNLKTTPSPLFFDPSSFAGARARGGDLLALGSMSELALYDGTGFTRVPGEVRHSGGLYIDVKQSMIYEVEWGKLNRFPVRHPRLGTGAGEAWAPRP